MVKNMSDTKPCVYFLVFEKTGEFYIGSTGNFEKRLKKHFGTLKSGKHQNLKAQSCFDKGLRFAAFTVETETRKDAYDLEHRLILENLDNVKMLNIGVGNDNLSRNPNRDKIIEKMKVGLAATREAMGPAIRKRIWGMCGEKNPMFGKTHSEETKKKISEHHKGKSYSKGRKLSEAHRKKISEFAKARVGAKNPFYGKKHSDEYKQWASVSRKGIKPVNSNKIRINGVLYESQADAARELGVSNALITYRLYKKEKYPDYEIVETATA